MNPGNSKNESTNRPANYIESTVALMGMSIIIGIGHLGLEIRIEPLMILSAVLAAILAKKVGCTWMDLEEAISHRIGQVTPAILIIWIIGMVIGTFMFSGSIPMIIYYGLKIINPKYLYACAFIICVILSIVTGTSWGSAGTLGVAMIGVAAGLNVPLHITAAAVICGAIVGDKLSPLSETTNLAALCAGTGLFKHIGSMLWTTIPAAVISFFVFLFAGLNINIDGTALPQSAIETMNILSQMYDWNWVMVIPFLIILICAFTKQPPVPTMIGASFVAVLVGVTTQGFDLASGMTASIHGFDVSMVFDGEVTPDVAVLLNRGGMVSMVGVVIIIYCGYSYAAIISRAGFLETALRPILKRVNSRFTAIAAALATDFIILCFAGSSYVAHILVGEMYKKKFIDNNIDLRVLSRTMEDVGTMMAPLIPWGSSAAFYVAALGVQVYGEGGYGIWAVNTWLNAFFALILAFIGIGMYNLSLEEKERELMIIKEEEKVFKI